MGVTCLILGKSGSGKSTSLRNFGEGEVGIFNVAGKPLPFRNRLASYNLKRAKVNAYGAIEQSLAKNNMRAYVIDDANYLMAFQNFALADVKGYDKFTQMAVNFEHMLEVAAQTDDDTIVYVMMHPDYDDVGNMKPKTIGKMLDNQLTVEGMFPICLVAEHDQDGYCFMTEEAGTPAKAPMGMFGETVRLDNDLKAVDDAIREYWGMGPIKAPEKKEPKKDKVRVIGRTNDSKE